MIFEIVKKHNSDLGVRYNQFTVTEVAHFYGYTYDIEGRERDFLLLLIAIGV